MDLDYDCKFEEMKKYIPFLESMIKRLEKPNSSLNPRQAQLDKIRSLRDLLLDKKKRMKMENLLKCEQVLINLYEKVEQRDSLPVSKQDDNSLQKDKADLTIVRNKLKSAVSKLYKETETLPEIARASETEEVCVPGSKEPALFQRRPNKSSTSPTRPLLNKVKETSPQMSKRNYTRVLLSPEPNQKHRSHEENTTEKPLFSRRSPRKSPRRRSPTYHKKERRKSSQSKTQDVKSKDLNITLNVPEESLDSLNTKDILSRIINCSDNDVDIATLRDLRSQILGELKDTGTTEDISDLILKSYRKKSKKDKKIEEIEEGELSDSESEAIDSIYGSLLIKDKDNLCLNTSNRTSNDENQRKIKICLVFNSDKNKPTTTKQEQGKTLSIDKSDFETFVGENSNCEKKLQYNTSDNIEKKLSEKSKPNTVSDQKIPIELDDQKTEKTSVEEDKESASFQKSKKKEATEIVVQKSVDVTASKEIIKPNFYKPIVEEITKKKYLLNDDQAGKIQPHLSEEQLLLKTATTSQEIDMSTENINVDIPLLEPTKKVSEIDILQALKKEILSETHNVLSSDEVTPPLHQPKLTKVVNAHEIGCKKRISIENYKAKSNAPSKNTLRNETSSGQNKDDVSRKNSLKLTEKECERFNFLSKLTLDESSDDEDMSVISVDDMYDNLAPKSPDHEDFADTGIKPPVIIPSDPVHTLISSEADIDMRKNVSGLNTDKIIAFSCSKENSFKSFHTEKDITTNKEKTTNSLLDPRKKKDVNSMATSESPTSYVDKTPRSAINSAASINLSQTVSSHKPLNMNVATNTRIMSPSMSGATPNLTATTRNLPSDMIRLPNLSNIPNMTPTRCYDVTPSRQMVDNDDFINKNHVYAPMFPIVDKRDLSEKQWDGSDSNRLWIREDPRSSSSQRDIDYRDTKNMSVKRDTDVRGTPSQRDIECNPYQRSPMSDRFTFDKVDPSCRMDRMECPTTPIHPFGRLDCPATPTPSFGRMDIPMTPVHPFGRLECPATPNHSFGRLECPTTPIHPFGRLECPTTPSHPFGRTECPATTNHPFGRLDCPPTPNHPFGRLECPPTPNHPFGRLECPATPNHPFGRPEISSSNNNPFNRPEPLLVTPFARPDLNQHIPNQSFGKSVDPRLNRNSEYENYHNTDDDRDQSYFHEHKYNSYKSDNNRNNNPEFYRRFQREQSIGRNERNTSYDNSGRNYRDQRRETNYGRYNRDYNSDKLYSRNRGSDNRNHDYRHQNEYRNYDETDKRNYYREKNISRNSRSTTSESSMGKTFSKDNQLSVHRHTGHSFTIDTSVNTTFQDKSYKNSFDARRQRAASVGRTLSRCSSPNKGKMPDSKQTIVHFDNKNKFRRACSVGREIKENQLDFKDIKADLKSFKLKNESRWNKELTNTGDSSKPNKHNDSCSRKELKSYDSQEESNAKYSARRNNRDPRVRRENTYERKNNYRDDKKNKSRDSRVSGIVYSNDNITKGTILGPGYGVKNYKIPKIKRPQEQEMKDQVAENKVREKAFLAVENKFSEMKNNSDKAISEKKESKLANDKGLDFKNNSRTKEGKTNNLGKRQEVKCDLNKSLLSENLKETTKNKIKDIQTINKSSDLQDVTCDLEKSLPSESLKETIKVKVARTISISSDLQEDTNNYSKKQETVMQNNYDDVANNLVENVEKRITRSVSKSLSLDSSLEISPIKRPKRGKKPLFYDSDSDDNNKKENATSENVHSKEQKTDIIRNCENDIKENKEDKNETFLNETLENPNLKKVSNSLDTGFEIDDLEIFSDNIATDPVIDNINALIADLDQDLDPSKTAGSKNNFTRELTLETMLENITSPEENETTSIINEDLSETELEECVNSNTQSDYIKSEVNSKLDIIKKTKDIDLQIENNPKLGESKCSENIEIVESHCIDIRGKAKSPAIEKRHSDEAIVSTSGDEDKLSEDSGLQKPDILNMEGKPDSTINISSSIDSVEGQRNLPDSTNELNSETNAVISSTHNTTDTTNEKNIAEPKAVLKKIKELLSILGEHSGENEKFKKKLEQLSEIVSDDDENILEEQKTNSSELQFDKRINTTPVLQQQNKEISSKDNSSLELLEQSTEEQKEVGSSMKESKDEEVVFGPNNEISGNEEERKINSESEVLNDEFHLNKKDNTPLVLQQEQNKEISSKVNRSLELFEQSIEENKEVGSSMKESKDNEIICGPNDEVSVKEGEHEIATDSEILKDESDNHGNNVLISEETQVTAKKIKNVAQKKGKKKTITKVSPADERRLTRSDAANLRCDKTVLKKPSRELQKLQDDIREMFIRDDVLSATGIRMCRLAKLVDEVKVQKEDQTSEINNQEPVVVLEKCNDVNISEDSSTSDKLSKKKTVKVKKKPLVLDITSGSNKPLNKNLIVKLNSSSVTNLKVKDNNYDVDPYLFESDSVNGLNNVNFKKDNKSSESENESVSSSRSFGSTDAPAEVKKKVKRKRIRKGWKEGVIKQKNKKKKIERKLGILSTEDSIEERKELDVVLDCYTDKSYCFDKNLSTYDCRLCSYNGEDIVLHYKKQHPHSEIPLSRLSASVAMEAIKESEKINFQAMCKVSSKKYTCRFCFKEFGRQKPVLELFFWHIVSYHTGEYKQLCAECLNVTRCPFKLDIPPPPKDNKGQLLGYVCEKCNFTQVSLENLKTHVIRRHNDEQTAVYTINLSVPTKNIVKNFLTQDEDINNTNTENQLSRILRSSRSNQGVGESSDVKSDTTDESFRNRKKRRNMSIEQENMSKVEKPSKIQSKITFENDNTDEISNFDGIEISKVKTEPELTENQDNLQVDNSQYTPSDQAEEFGTLLSEKIDDLNDLNDICRYPHFKIKYSESGSKVYICCINGNDLHYRTTLLISFKKHVQLKHSEKWDGFCFICKVIVTPQGVHSFKDCLQHFLDQHIDSFPVLEETSEQLLPSNELDANTVAKPYINVRPMAELISHSSTSHTADEGSLSLPVIESVVSLGTGIEQCKPSPSYPTTATTEVVKQYRHEEAQSEVMSRKYCVVLEAMLSKIKLVQVFKCSGRFCSFTTDNAEDALLHASTHSRVGGEDSLKCVYCDFDSSNNAIDLITHVFKSHGCCQYVCGMCFYRAAASQLVNAHIKRVHPTASSVTIFYTALQTAPIREDNILSRETAVPYYLCCSSTGSDAPCKFRTYTPGKFCEHLQLKHPSGIEHSCFMCPTVVPTPADLIRHLKTHGLKLYQCTWCVFGADNETELLEHASEKHPDKQPKAYLRIITNKEGTLEFRVLPLAHLNKLEIPVEQVKSSSVRENPVREAERSIDLEKLISQTTLMIESIPYVSETEAETEATGKTLSDVDKDPSVCESVNVIEDQTKTSQHQEKSTDVSENVLLTSIKTETAMSPEKPLPDPHVVYCLDSDEEEASKNVTNETTDPASPNKQVESLKTLPSTQLFLCSKCGLTLSCGAGFKKHVTACFMHTSGPIPCAHCLMKLPRKTIVSHYSKMHAESARQYLCPKCPNKFFTTLAQVREHERNDHSLNANDSSNVDKTAVATCSKPGSNKRKRSLGNKEKGAEPLNKVKKFGPHNVNLLPINPILDNSVFCSLCGFSTKVRLNMVRHLQLHAEQQIVPQTAPVNPVPHLESNEKHFDKMLNLASSSIVSRTPEKNKIDSNTTITLMISPEAVSRYPKFVPERHRHTCGAKGCTYISVDESMFKCHWETLHSGTNDYRCVHCPPHQQLDTSKPLTAVRIIAHLKMHDSALYACSLCSYYHYKRHIVENHLSDVHKGGQVMVVREEGCVIPVNPTQAQMSAPTMDLKPWFCGLCNFKSLLRLEVVDHCAKIHNSKMQYKCAYCAFRTSNPENITKHQAKSHSDKKEEIFYYYYREDSVPQNPDGIPLWQKQSQKCDIEPRIKSEVPSEVSPSPQVSLPSSKVPVPEVDLDLVKKEVIEPVEETIQELCKQFGTFCEPNGLKYKCTLCKNVVEDDYDAMQSHLYEELQYRKWGCSICSYKAFHKVGLSGHMQTEHRQNKEAIALEIDSRIETWVTKLLQYQTEIIEKNKENLALQKQELLRSTPGPSRPKSPILNIETSQMSSSNNSSNKPSMVELERLFGSLGVSVNMSFCCPKCQATFKDEDAMKNHLENELNKIRWSCTNCSIKFQTYHEAQFHCRSVHIGQSARPVEATRDLSIRSAWIEAVIRIQKLSMNYVPLHAKNVGKSSEETAASSDVLDNSLLVVRYEERVNTPEEQMARRTPVPTVSSHDSDDDKLIIDEPETRKAKVIKYEFCAYCNYKSLNSGMLRCHVLRHYNLNSFMCPYCDHSAKKRDILDHQKIAHENLPLKFLPTPIPKESPQEFLKKIPVNAVSTTKLICLVCRNVVTEAKRAIHVHDKIATSFGRKGDVIVKCNICFTFHTDVNVYLKHHKSFHTHLRVDYTLSKLTVYDPKKMVCSCSICGQVLNHSRDLKIHTDAIHGSNMSMKAQEIVRPNDEVINLDEEEDTRRKRKSDYVADVPPHMLKRVARKSTTKLWCNKPFARKSTTKLPFVVQSESEEFSYYGTRPSNDDYDNVTTMMSFCNTMMPFTLKKLSKIININPVVKVEKLKKP